MHSYLITGLRMGPLMKLLRRHGFTPSPRNLGRLIFLMHNASWASFFTWRENNVHGHKINSWPVPDDPLIIIGHWRTGSTFLHLLLSKDEQMVAPSLFQTAFPECFLTADKYYRPVMGRMLKERPMDNVRLGFDDPQEDEFALMKLTEDSPLWDIVFHEKPGYFINHYKDFDPLPEHRDLWREKLIYFYKKIRKDTGKILLLKNPAHSLRIPLLCETFPNARFIHLHRHPYNVVASSLHLWKILMRDNRLKGKAVYPTTEEVADGLGKFYDVITRDLEAVPANRKSELAFEELVTNPVREIRRVYHELGLEFTKDFEGDILCFLDQNKDFKRNSYTFEEKDKEYVYQKMKRHFERYHYLR